MISRKMCKYLVDHDLVGVAAGGVAAFASDLTSHRVPFQDG
jgi:hypothetical protein